jgi:acyl carrier protein
LPDEIEIKLKSMIAQIVETGISSEEIQLDDSIASFGVNSQNFVKLIIAIEAEFGFEFPVTDLLMSKYRTLDDLVKKVKLEIGTE